MLILAPLRNGKLYLLTSLLQFGQESNFLRIYCVNYYYACHSKCFIWHTPQLEDYATNCIKYRMLTGCDV